MCATPRQHPICINMSKDMHTTHTLDTHTYTTHMHTLHTVTHMHTLYTCCLYTHTHTHSCFIDSIFSIIMVVSSWGNCLLSSSVDWDNNIKYLVITLFLIFLSPWTGNYHWLVSNVFVVTKCSWKTQLHASNLKYFITHLI